MKIALLQINPTVGDLSGNAELIANGAREAGRLGADLVVTPELALLGYLPRDLLLKKSFIDDSWAVLEQLAEELAGGPPVLVGLAEPNRESVGRPLFNVAALLRAGKVTDVFRKSLLPTYDVFDEDRYFEPGPPNQLLNLDGWKLGVCICEDVWNDRDFWERPRYHADPIAELKRQGAQVLINMSASPFTIGKQALRVLRWFGNNAATRVHTNIGPEQEYFLVDRRLAEQRPDLLLTGRTLFGAPSPKA